MSSALVDEEVVAVSREDAEVNYQKLLLLILLIIILLLILILSKQEEEISLLLLLTPILIMIRWLRWDMLPLLTPIPISIYNPNTSTP